MVIQSDDYIILDGVSSNTVGLYCDTPPVPPMARQRYTVYQTGAEQDGTTADNTFEDMDIPFNLYTFLDEDFDNTAVYRYLLNKSRLEFSRHSGFYYKIRQVNVSPPQEIADGRRIGYTVTFTVAPFRYSTENSAISVSSGDIVENTGNYYSRPLITLTATGDVTISVNGREFTLSAVAGTVNIDSERHIVYSGNNIIYNKDSGSYPLLGVGSNRITYTGTVTSMSIVKNERCL